MSKDYLWKYGEGRKRKPLRKRLSEEDRVAAYVDEIADAMEVCSESEGFICIAVKRIPWEDKQLLVPLTFGLSTTKEASVLLDAQLLQVAAHAYAELVRQLGT